MLGAHMEMALQDANNAAAEIAASNQPLIRHLKIKHRASLRPLDDLPPSTWLPSHPANAGQFSAAASFFARKLHRELGVPVGVINSSWGGSHLETWTSPRAALLGACRAWGRARVDPENGLSLGAKHSHTVGYGEHLQRRISPFSGPTRRAGEIFGAGRRCRLVVWLGHTPSRRLARHRNSPRRGPDPKPDRLLDPTLAAIVQNLPADNAGFAAQNRVRAEALVARWQPGLPLAQPGQEFAPGAWAQEQVDDSGWPELAVPQVWEQQGLAGFDGDVWFRRTVDLTEAQAAGGATLHLCMIDDCGEAFVNGARVGGVCGWNVLRHHAVPPGVLRAGRNQIAVRVTDTGGDDGFYGDPAALQLETPAGKLPLAGRWKARVASVLSKTEPTANDAPTLLFNGMVQPLLPMAVRGVLWYQGESNVPRAAGYAAAFQGLITDWRAQWGQPNMPIYFVQLASFLPLERNTLAGSAWAELRDAQRQALALPYTGMVVATDLGDEHDIHPKNKQAIGDRLARLALHGVHGKPVVASGPVWRAMRVRGRQIELTFSHQHTGLAARGEHGLAAADGSPLSGFAIADASGRFVPALAQLQGGRVVVSSPAVAQPVAVRYGWVDNPSLANLVNAAGLPASPFRTDHWPGVTDGVGFAP